jgi:hypothetical protein
MVIEEKIKIISNVKEYSNLKNFKNDCLNSEQDFCLIGLVDARKNNLKSMEGHAEAMETYTNLNTHGSFSKDYKIHWVNATCHVFFLSKK